MALSKGFINTKNGKSDLLEQLKFKRKQLLVQKMSQELVRKQEAAQQKEQQKNQKDDGHGQIVDGPMSKRESPRGQPALPVSADAKLEDLENEISYIGKLQDKHEELIQSQARIHKGIQDIWRRQLQQQRESQLQDGPLQDQLHPPEGP